MEIPKPIEVTKFGGHLMGTGREMLSSAASIAQRKDGAKQVIVVSAAKGITDLLVETADHMNNRRLRATKENIDLFVHTHEEIVDALPFSGKGKLAVNGEIFDAAEQLNLYDGTYTLHPAMRDYVLSMGEYVSSHIFNTLLKDRGIDTQRVDAYKVIRTDSSYGNAAANVPESRRQLRKHVLPKLSQSEVVVIPGYYGVDNKGYTTTMPRNSSDYSAAIAAYALDATSLSLCKGIDGVYDRHPSEEGAVFLPFITFTEALRLSLNGGKVVYPDTMLVLQESGIPIHVFGLENPQKRTVIASEPM